MKIASVFSGAGSFEYAFKRLKIDHRIVFACDNDKFVKQTYFANYKREMWFDCITKIKWFDCITKTTGIGDIDILCGGSPCQSFSTIGHQKGFEDPRGNLFFEFIRVINDLQPKVFIFENVPSAFKGEIGDIILSEFYKTGYFLHRGMLNSKDYGVPQNRKRAFIVGFKEERNFSFPKTLKLEKTMLDLLDDVVPDKYYLSEKQKAHALKSNAFNNAISFDNEIARCLKANFSNRAGRDNYYNRQGKLTKMTPREFFRTMGFDDDFNIVVSDSQAYKQAGNSIVVNVLEGIIKQIIKR